MNRPLPLSLVLFAAPIALLAQPTINPINVPVIGDVVTIGLCSDIVDASALNSSAGAMQTWDFSGLTETTEEEFTFVDPASTPWASDFPASNLCGISWDGSHSYYITNANALETEGNAMVIPGSPPEDTAKFIFAVDHERILELPYTFGDGHIDGFSGTFNAGAFMGTMDGTIDVDVDGYGTLILPNGTYTNVVRYHFNRTQNNTILGNTTTQTKEQWGWVSEDHRFWLLLMEINFDGFATNDIVWYDKSPIMVGQQGMDDPAGSSLGLYPSPASTGSSVTITGATNLANAHVRIIDALGRTVLMGPVMRGAFSTTGLVPGQYLVRLLDANGRTARIGRLVIE
ncbi:MAG: T9SS type A sorting domain-containing protein [Flavobacteriales bacterium]|nr:T9SS type A sorting domain-containing protein [Flavobacteriales bacterium]